MDDLHVVAAAAELSERGYIVRPAAESDLPRLVQLEELCWQHTRTSQQQLLARVQRYPEGQFVLEKSGQVLGAVYSQRIRDVAALASRSAADVHELHDASGSIVQLLALNVDPAVQNLSLGDQLLEFALQRCGSMDGVDRVVGVTLCKRFDSTHGLSFDDYIHRQDGQQDPVLALHCSHGATVVGSIANYRPEDVANQHNGVLVSYDIRRRQVRSSTKQSDTAITFDRKEVERFVRAEVARIIGDEQGFDSTRPLMEMGLTSADLLQLQLQMQRQFGCTLRPGFFFEHNCVDKVVAYFSTDAKAAPEKQASRPASKQSKGIAIVGMSCRLPGGIETPDDLWEVLAAAECMIGSYPKRRGNWPSAAKYPGIDQGGYLADGDAFDASFFRVSPTEAQITDPQQRILLELAWSCLEDAGVLPAHLRGTRTGVFVGASNCDYSRLIQTAGVETEAHHATGSSLAIIANRLSYFLDLSGPSMLIDTACSSSLVALHAAVQSLHAGECDSALVGGVNFICHPDLSVAYHKAGMLARDGRCKVFDARANGYVRAEGGVMLLLKPLSEAIRAHDNIHAVIRGSAVNHGGLSGGLTVPDPKKQSELLIAAWNSAGISPRELSYIEAHGTGTSLGDPIEVQGIQTAYSSLVGVSADKTCAVGSLKSNLGHLESAAGIAGVLKVVLSMQHRQLPGQPTFDQLNPKIILDDSPFYVAERHQGWQSNQRRLAGVSSFGSGGANAHCVVQEYVAEAQDTARVAGVDHLFVISAADETRLRACARKIFDWLETNEPGERFGDAIYTWQAGRTAMKRRLAIKVRDAAELRAKLQQWLADSSCPADAWLDEVNSRDPSASRLWQEEEGLHLVERALAERNLGQLGAFWTSGADVDWRKLYSAEPRRISVPTYSFARESHWISVPEIETNEAAELPSASGHLLVTPVWESASTQAAAHEVGFREHRVLLCELPDVDAEKIRTSTQSNYCSHLRSRAESIEGRYVDHALKCFEEVKRILADKPRGRVLFQVVVPQQHGETLLAGLSGLLSTATRENPNLIGQMILTEAGINHDALATQLRREKDSSRDTLVKYSQGQRHVLRWREVGAADSSLLAFKHDGVYLITGGLGGLGRVFAKEILRHAVQARVVLTGRSALTDKQQRRLDELARLAVETGARAPEYRQLDLADLTQTQAVIEAITEQHQRIDGIIHCAGMISDSFILRKTAEEFKRVLEPKVTGTSNLDAASKDLQLDFLVLFSSFTSALGNVGQADYAAANGFMDQFAAYRNRQVDAGQRYGRTLSIHWPLWQEGGMTMDAESAETLRQATGIQPMQTAIGVRAFHDSLLSRNARTMVLEGDVQMLQQTLARANEIQASTLPTTSATTSADLLREATLKRIKQLFGEALKLPAAKVDADEPFSSYGIDSILINQMNRKLAEVFGAISKTLFFEYRTLAELTAHLVQMHAAGCVAWTGSTASSGAVATVTPSRRVEAIKPKVPGTSAYRREPIAIIGISGIYPQAATLDEFWKNLESGRSCVSEIPPERWSLDGFYVPDVEQAIAQGKSYSKWGGFIEQFAQFEPLFFNISPREALNMDPQERLFLQEAWRAMENAGYTRNDLKHRFQRKVGVFAGITKTGFELYATPAASIEDGFYPRTSFSSVANRVSYFLDLTGPSLPIDTMCSSSLTAIHEACEHINCGDCELAFAGGVNLYLHPATYTWLSSQQMLSRDGLCRSFGAGGNGYVPGEGVGVVLLKSLPSALRDNDSIHGIILATHVNHGGKANGYTVPSPRAQAELISRAIEKAGIKADDISYIEAHGTGTELGDPIEISGLQQTFAGTSKPCSIGSAKSNIGHLESAAGIAGLTKVLLQMKHRSIAPSLHASQLNPNIDFDKSAFRVNRSLSPWLVRSDDGKEAPRIAGISSFGAGGSNAHIIVQEFPVTATSSSTHEPHAILLSARTSEQLRQRARDLLAFVQVERAAFDLRSMAYTLQVGREAMEARLGMLVSSADHLVDKLQAFLAGEQDIEDIYLGQAKSNKETLRLFGGDEDFQATLDRWLARHKFSKLLELWAKGLDIEWDKLYESARPRRMALPTYPFNPERYWIDAVEGVRAWDAPAAPSIAPAAHPLLHTNTSNLDRQSYSSVFSGGEFFLRDHKVRGSKVLPAVAYLEMARAAVELASPKQARGRILELQHTAWLQPIAVSSSTEVSIALYLNESDPTEIDFEVQSAGAEAIHCQGQARWVDAHTVPGIDIPQLKAEMRLGQLNVEEFYGRFTQSGISYGPAHRAITGIHLGEGQLLAQLTLPGAVESTSHSYVLHPSLMDSALQGCLALIGESEGGPLLPFELDTLRVVAPCTSEMYAWVRRSDQLKFDVDLCDRLGNVCVEMSGFASRALDAGLASNAENQGLLYPLAPIWSRVRAQHAGEGRYSPNNILLLGEDEAPLAWLRQSYPQAEFVQLPANASIETMQELLEPRAFEHLLWIAPDVLAAQGEDDIVAGQERGVLTVFRIAKALLNSNRAERSLHWTLITRHTQNVRKTDRIAPTHGAVAGLVGSLAKEYPEWTLQLLDVDDLQFVSAEQCLTSPANKQGDCLAHRQGEWLVEGLARVGTLPESPAAYRQGGVYVVIGGAGGIGEVWSRFMVEHYQAQLVWIGRRPLDAAIEDKLQTLAQLGPAPRYFSADATRQDSLQATFEQIREIHPRIHGVVHSAIVLQDQSLSRMDEATFRSSLAAKVDVSVNMDAVFGSLDLDFMLFFSSLISFTKAPGQSNYAAGCTFKDSFAHSLARRRSYPIKIMNWGFWGNVGIVAAEFYNRRMQQMGFGSIEAPEAMDALRTLVSSDVNQLALVKAIDVRAVEGITQPETIGYASTGVTNVLPSLRKQISSGEPPAALSESVLAQDVMDLAEQILAASLQSFERARMTDPLLGRWLDASVEYLARQGRTSHANVEELWSSWAANEAVWQENPSTRPHLELLKVCLRALPEILSGTRKAADVMFPESSLRLVSGVYAGNAVSDYYNGALAQTLCACIRQRRQAEPSSKIRVLEIGAGTGGTTKAVLPLLREFDGAIEEYCYTDLSKAFLIHAEEHYRPGFPALRTALFDASKPLSSQAMAANQYDFVIATNVLHATADIRETMRNAKALLKKHGIILLNEMSEWSLFNHLTFGLLDGWWLYEDAALRIPGSPGLAPETWGRVLKEEGFENVALPAEQARAFGQQIIVASSDGRVRQRVSKAPQVVAGASSKRPTVAKHATPASGSTLADVPRTGLSLRDKAVTYLQGVVAKALRMEPSQLEPSRPLAEYGLDSIVVVGVTSQLRRAFTGVTSTLFFELRSIDCFADFILENKKEELIALIGGDEGAIPEIKVSVETRSVSRPSRRIRPQAATVATPTPAATPTVFDVAIIGIAGRYPQSANLSAFWNNLANGRNCVTEVPKDRWDWQEFFDAERGKAGKIYTKWGGFLDRIDGFDPLFFKIAPREAKAMDPQERLFLESCYHAIEDAGYTPASLGDIDKVGVFVGVMNSRYTPQPLHYSIANRVSYVMNFQGPSLAVDTACSASLTAIHLALESIYSGLSECAIAGGVNLIIDPVHYLELSALTMLSAGQECKSFGNEADGFVDAEGVGAIVLKPLSKAERDGDHIYGVIKGSALNAGGKTNGYTVPNPQAQSAVISKALRRANIAASEISYVEAHGTGTALGDPIEIAGLTRAFEQAPGDRQFCAIGSLKSNIGHCESAAGIAGLTKVLLQLEHKQLVPSLHADVPNPEIEFERTPFKVQRALEEWQRPRREVDGVSKEIARTAGISSFGAGGANAHIIVQEHEYATAVNAAAGAVIVPLSARTSDQLRTKACDLLDLLRLPDQSFDLLATAYTLQVGREPMEERVALVVASIDELAARLESFVAGEAGEETHRGRFKRSHGRTTAPTGVDEAVADRNLSRLAHLWTQGADIEWGKLYGDAKPRRISLPVYPFAKERYWRERTDAPTKLSVETRLHPLLHRNVSGVRHLGYSATFSGGEDFLIDHPVAPPPVVYLEMARAAIQDATASQSSTGLELFNVVWADTTGVLANDSINVALFARDDDQLDYEIYSQQDEGDTVHLQGQSVLSAEAPPTKLDIARLRAQMQTGKRHSNGFYSSLVDAGIHYGPAYQAVTEISLGDRELLAQISVPKATAELVLHPVVMDCALQAAFGLIPREQRPSQPLALESLRILGACGERMFAWVRYSQGEYTEQMNVQLDIDLCDPHGNVSVQMRGVTYELARDVARDTTGSLDSTDVEGTWT
ncbi:SDR family NAD(P)-dependent oxidoreductase [Peristeroidobacter agariperforans]|uniref:SDR family NAD(P)-dependent oxidoreductase n=1 Tax=Peristeroidobacter agariperforans TaxID=268404 RepID=UPI00101DB445|nr:SDR family NAD(P)-dependent oxidoreductase [Peristeroidobacter agariperforans]